MCQQGPYDPEAGATLLEAARTPGFAAALLTAAQGLDDVAEVYACRVPDGGRPQALAASGGLCNSDDCAEQYARTFFRHDPVMRLVADTSRGEGFSDRIEAAAIRRQDYRELCFDAANVADKMCFGFRDDQATLMVAFYRRPGARGEDRLRPLADLSLAALAAELRRGARSPVPLVARLETRLGHAYPALTWRERQVAARGLAGLTADETAAELGIGAASVITYRQRAYARHGYARATDFLHNLID